MSLAYVDESESSLCVFHLREFVEWFRLPTPSTITSTNHHTYHSRLLIDHSRWQLETHAPLGQSAFTSSQPFEQTNKLYIPSELSSFSSLFALVAFWLYVLALLLWLAMVLSGQNQKRSERVKERSKQKTRPIKMKA